MVIYNRGAAGASPGGYILVKDQRSVFVATLEQHSGDFVPAVVVWSDKTRLFIGEQPFSGGVYKYTLNPDDPNVLDHPHSAIPALDDIQAFENKTVRTSDKSALIQLSLEGSVFLHVMGEYTDDGVRYLAVIQRNGTVKTYDPHSISEKETWNVHAKDQNEAVIRYEAERSKDPRNSFRDLHAYSFEDDEAIHIIYINGEQYGFNNRRAMTGMVSRALRYYPHDVMLVHRSGSMIDYNFSRRLLLQNTMEGFVQRKSERFKM